MRKRFPFFRQLDAMDCGATCLQITENYLFKQSEL